MRIEWDEIIGQIYKKDLYFFKVVGFRLIHYKAKKKSQQLGFCRNKKRF